jgi:hypothetical protein
MNTRWLMTLACLSCMALPLRADDTTRTTTDETQRTVTEDRRSTADPNGRLGQMAQTYNVQEQDIRDLREKGWSWNEIGSALAVSKRSGKALPEVVADRDAGQSWPQIAEKNGFRFSEVQGEAKKIAKDGKRYDKGNRAAVRGTLPEPTKPNVTPQGTERGRGGAEVPSNNPGTDSSEEMRGTPRGPQSIDQSHEGPGDNQTPR